MSSKKQSENEQNDAQDEAQQSAQMQNSSKSESVAKNQDEKTAHDSAQESDKQSEQDAAPKTDAEKVVELTDLLKRKQAEFVNYQNRMESMQREQTKFAAQRLIEKLIPIVDMFDLSVAHKEQKDQFIAGMEMIHSQLGGLLESEGVEAVDLLDKLFDPALAQAVSVEPRDDVQPNTVIAQHQKCYRLGNRTIRYARVVVSAKPDEESSEVDNETHEKTKNTAGAFSKQQTQDINGGEQK